MRDLKEEEVLKREIGERVKLLRKNDSQKRTQKELAEKLNVSESHISKIEQGHYRISYTTAIEIADYYNVSLDWLLCRTEEKDDINKALDILCADIKLRTSTFSLKHTHVIPYVCISKRLYAFLTALNRAHELLENNADLKDVVDAWLEKEKKKFLSSPKPKSTSSDYGYLSSEDFEQCALLSAQYINDEVAELLTNTYNNMNT